jgi:hypothetical protein
VHLLDFDAPAAIVDLSGASTLYYRNFPSWGTLALSGGSRVVNQD